MRVIDVEELLKRLNQLYEEQGLTPEWTGDDWDDGAGSIFIDIVEIINEQPIEPVKRGKWEIHLLENGGHIFGKSLLCSECGFFWREELYRKNFKYCPNCGAKMDGDNK
jgi:hypothetical protein